VFHPGQPFQPSLVFAGKAGAYPSAGVSKYVKRMKPVNENKVVEQNWTSLPERNTSNVLHLGWLLALPTNVRLRWKDLPWTDALAY
jgi:hypothetical protein